MFWTKCPESVVDNFGFGPKFAPKQKRREGAGNVGARVWKTIQFSGSIQQHVRNITGP
jgi:hypothetical protein